MENVIRLAGGGDMPAIIECCKQLFNKACGEDFFREDNFKASILNPEKGIADYKDFCEQYFPNYLSKYSDDYTQDGYVDTFRAQAFVNGDIYGIIIRQDAAERDENLYAIILHEMSHIFCIVREKGGINFFNTYCIDNENKVFAIGYSIWREFIADYMAAHINPFFEPLSIVPLRKSVRFYDDGVVSFTRDSKGSASCLLADIFLSTQICSLKSIKEVLYWLETHNIFKSKLRLSRYNILLELIFLQISKEECWKISLDFIESLGSAYMGIVAWTAVDSK